MTDVQQDPHISHEVSRNGAGFGGMIAALESKKRVYALPKCHRDGK